MNESRFPVYLTPTELIVVYKELDSLAEDNVHVLSRRLPELLNEVHDGAIISARERVARAIDDCPVIADILIPKKKAR